MKLKNPVFLRNFFSKGIGLMFRKNISKPYIFIFNREKIISLHMWFVFTNLSVLYLDKSKRIVEIAELKPFTFYTPKNKAKYVIELQKNSLKKFEVGQKLEF